MYFQTYYLKKKTGTCIEAVQNNTVNEIIMRNEKKPQ